MINRMKPKHHRATEARRTNFRAFRVFRSYTFLAFLFLAAPLLLAPAPAPAQSPAILLDAKSATGESLLTINDQGDLWIKGALIEYAYPGLITLDPSRQYWTLRDTDGNVLWALEVYNPATGVSTGDLHAACTFESYCDNVEQDDAIFTCRTASGEAVYTLSASRRAKAKGKNQTQTQATDFHGPPPSYTPPTPDADAPAPNFLPDLAPYLTPQHWNTYLHIPQAQARVYCPADPLVTPQARDVTNMAWRRKLSADITTLEGHGVRYGLRCTDAVDLYLDDDPVTPRWWWSIGPPPQIWEDDVGICDDGYGGTEWWPVMDGGPYWSLLSYSPLTLTAAEYAAPISVQYTLQNTIQNGGNDGQVTATSDMFLHTVHFHHPGPNPRDNIPPRKAGDNSVNVGCCLMPRNIPAAWIHHIELTLWDPAYPSHRRVFKNTESECTRASFVGKPFISKMWDGKLWMTADGKPDPQNPNDFYYTQASDFFMQAIVYWRPAYPVPGCTEGGSHVHSAACWKPWENGNYESSDEFQEPRHAIVVEDYDWGPVSGDPYNFAWITPGGVTAPPQMPLLYGYIVANGGAALPETADWHLHVTFNRPTRNDSDTYPTGAPGYATVPGGQEWVVNFGGDFRGGKATTSCAFGGKTLTHVFHIRGEKPSDETTLAHINANNTDTNQFSHWYATKMARQESSLQHFIPATQQNPLPGPNEQTNLVGQPKRGTSVPYGWGLFQLTHWWENQQENLPTPQHLWNWHVNTAKAIDILRLKRLCNGQTEETHTSCGYCAVGWVARQRGLMHTYRSGQSPPQPDLPIPAQTYGGAQYDATFGDNQDHPAVDACTISNYNPGVELLFWDNNAVPEPTWKWRTDTAFDYITEVCSQQP